MNIPVEVVILDSLADDDETITTGIRSELDFFKIPISDVQLIQKLEEMCRKELIQEVHFDEVFGKWYTRTERGVEMWKQFPWNEWTEFINQRNIELNTKD